MRILFCAICVKRRNVDIAGYVLFDVKDLVGTCGYTKVFGLYRVLAYREIDPEKAVAGWWRECTTQSQPKRCRAWALSFSHHRPTSSLPVSFGFLSGCSQRDKIDVLTFGGARSITRKYFSGRIGESVVLSCTLAPYEAR